jgi:hypothetical protein
VVAEEAVALLLPGQDKILLQEQVVPVDMPEVYSLRQRLELLKV